MAQWQRSRLGRPRLGPVLAALVVALMAAYMFHLSGGMAGEFRSHAGEFLVADESMPDGRFRQSVILMIRHDEEGALGVIVNKPLAVDAKIPLWALIGELDDKGPEYQKEVALNFGGPVDRRRLFVVHDDSYANEGTIRLSAGLAATLTAAPVHDIAKGEGPSQLLLTLGYAGWGPGQLEFEIARGSWHWVAADAEMVFGGADTQKWTRAYARRGIDL